MTRYRAAFTPPACNTLCNARPLAFPICPQFARKVGDAQIPRPWSKHSAGSTANRKQQQQQEEAEAGKEGGKGGKEAKGKAAKKKERHASPLPEDGG